MGLINNNYVLVQQEEVNYDSESTSHPVETGIELTDHVRRKPITLSLSGVIVKTGSKKSADIIANIKKLQKEGFSKPVVKGAYVQDCVFIGEDKLDQLASIKTREELIGDIIALLQSPIQRVIGGLENASEGKSEDEKVGAKIAQEAAPAAESAAETPAAE